MNIPLSYQNHEYPFKLPRIMNIPLSYQESRMIPGYEKGAM